MDEKKIAEYRKNMKKREGLVGALLIGCLIVGAGVLFYGMWAQNVWGQVVDEDHMTDPSIPYNERENATYTWSSEDILEKVTDLNMIYYAGGVLIAVGYAGALTFAALSPDKKKDHLRYCANLAPYKIPGWENIEIKYCPECGLELKKLEKG